MYFTKQTAPSPYQEAMHFELLARHDNDLSYQLMQFSAESQKSLVWLPGTMGDELIDVHSFTISFQYPSRAYYMPGTVPIPRDTTV